MFATVMQETLNALHTTTYVMPAPLHHITALQLQTFNATAVVVNTVT
jgi:hypothetical protein